MAGPPFALLAICHQSKQEQLQPKRKVQPMVISLSWLSSRVGRRDDSQSVAFQRDGGAAVCRNSEFWLQLLLLSWQIAKSANGGPATRLQMVST